MLPWSTHSHFPSLSFHVYTMETMKLGSTHPDSEGVKCDRSRRILRDLTSQSSSNVSVQPLHSNQLAEEKNHTVLVYVSHTCKLDSPVQLDQERDFFVKCRECVEASLYSYDLWEWHRGSQWHHAAVETSSIVGSFPGSLLLLNRFEGLSGQLRVWRSPRILWGWDAAQW